MRCCVSTPPEVKVDSTHKMFRVHRCIQWYWHDVVFHVCTLPFNHKWVHVLHDMHNTTALFFYLGLLSPPVPNPLQSAASMKDTTPAVPPPDLSAMMSYAAANPNFNLSSLFMNPFMPIPGMLGAPTAAPSVTAPMQNMMKEFYDLKKMQGEIWLLIHLYVPLHMMNFGILTLYFVIFLLPWQFFLLLNRI